METSNEVRQLQDFNNAAVELFTLSFTGKLKDSGVTIKAKKGEAVVCEFRGPDDEAIKAYCNDLRKFIQPNDTLKIEKLIPLYQSDLALESEKKIFNQTISEYDKFKNQQTIHELNGVRLTNQRIFEVFLYGEMSHRSKGTKEVHDSWRSFPPLYILLKNEFVTILYEYLRIINNIAYANNLVLERLGYPKIESKVDGNA